MLQPKFLLVRLSFILLVTGILASQNISSTAAAARVIGSAQASAFLLYPIQLPCRQVCLPVPPLNMFLLL